MLQGLRDKAQGWIAWTIILVICFIFALWGIEHYLQGNSTSDYVAKVNGVTITKAQLASEYERVKRQGQAQLDVTNQESVSRLKQQVLNQLVTSQVLVQTAMKSGFRVTQQQIDVALSAIPVFQENNNFSAQRFNIVLGKLGYSPDEFIGLLSSDILINQVQAGIVASAFVLPSEVENALRLTGQKRSISYAILPINQYLQTQNISEEAAKTYYNQHQQAFKTTEQVSIEYLKLAMEDIKAGLSLTREEKEQYYKANIDSFTSPAQWQIAHILVNVPSSATDKEVAAKKVKITEVANQLRQNKDFAELAAKYSEDADTANKGGVLPWLNAGNMKEDMYQKTVKVLKPGMVSNPIQTSKGFEIIKLIAVKPGQVSPFEQVEAQIQKILLQQKAQQFFSAKSDKLANLTYSNPDSLQAAASALNLKVEKSDFFTRKGSKTGVASNPKVVAAAFNADVLTRKNNSSVIELNPDTIMVLRIAQFQPVEILPFSKVKQQIIDKLAFEQAKQKVQAVGEDIVKLLQTNKMTVTELTNKYHLNWHTIDKMPRNDAKVMPGVLELAFNLPKPKDKNTPSINGNHLASGDFAIVKLFAVHEDTQTVNVEQRQAFAEKLANSFGQLDYDSYTKMQLNQAKIVYDTHSSNTETSVTASLDD